MTTSSKNRTSRWRMSDFFLQLSTVVIGIIITFGGSSLIQRSAQRKEARNILQMVRNELQTNIESVRGYQDFLKFDIEGCKALRPYIVAGTPEKIPVDTLEKYRQVFVRTRTYGATTNSFETLQTSPMMKVTNNSELMNALFGIYMKMEGAQNMTEHFISAKQEGWRRIYDSMDSQIADTFFNSEGLMKAFMLVATSDAGAQLRNYIITVARGNNNYQVTMADEFVAEIEKVIQMIDKEIGQPSAS